MKQNELEPKWALDFEPKRTLDSVLLFGKVLNKSVDLFEANIYPTEKYTKVYRVS
jgi:hypothetical protein